MTGSGPLVKQSSNTGQYASYKHLLGSQMLSNENKQTKTRSCYEIKITKASLQQAFTASLYETIQCEAQGMHIREQGVYLYNHMCATSNIVQENIQEVLICVLLWAGVG